MERRSNDELILYKLDELKEDISNTREEVKIDIGTMQKKFDSHVESTNHVIHGNGSEGLKTKVEVLRTRMTIMASTLGVALAAIINDYFNRG